MKIEINTSSDKLKDGKKTHQGMFFFVAIVVLVFAVLYIHGFIEYSK
jgi:hypothetical protein